MWRLLTVVTLLLFARPAAAQDVWTTPYPGIRMLRRSTPRPVVFWALVIDTCAPGIRFRASGPTEGNRVTSMFGRMVGAQMAINGDFADHDFGLNLGGGRAWPYPDTEHSGNFSVGPNRIEMTPDYEVLAAPAPWVTEQLGGRWTLLNNGVPQLGIDDNGPASGGFVCAPGLRHPRTAIGLSRNHQTVMVLVADGRSSASLGMTCDELIAVFQELGAHDAMGLDGGGSSTLWQSDRLINHPTDASGERVVRNHLAVFASGTGPAPHCGLRTVVTEPPLARAVPGAALPTVVPLTPPSRITLVTPTRIFDTRTPEGSAALVREDGSSAGPLSLSSPGAFRAWPSVGVRPDATAVWLNVTSVGLQVPGFVTVFPNGRPRPETSNVNFDPGQAVANAVPVALGASSQVNFGASTAVEVIADLAGSFGPTGSGLSPVGPTRVLDTRTPSNALRAGVTRRVDVRAPAGALGVAASVAVIARESAGFLTASPCDAPVPPTSNINFAAGAVVANAVVSALGAGQLCLTSSSDIDVVVDVTGYFTPDATLSYVPLFPQRVLDTRAESTLFTGRVGAGQVLEIPVQRVPGMPSSAGAVVANLTVTSAAGPGFLTAFPCGSGPPEASTVNFPAERAVGAMSLTALGGGALCLVSSVRAHVLVDLLGVWVPRLVAAPDAGVPAMDAGPPRDAGGTVDVPTDGTPRDVTLPRDLPVFLDAFVVTDLSPRDGGSLDMPPPDAGCGCRATRHTARSSWGGLVALALLASARRRPRGRFVKGLDPSHAHSNLE